MNIGELIKTIGDSFASTANVKTVYGDPVSADGRTVIPVAEVRYGFGAGGGKSDKGGGGGGRVVAIPAGALEITSEGTGFIPFDDRPKLARALAMGFVLGALLTAFTRRSRS